ncbi:uncharacterized protein KZ484_006504 [Pholidichthys leucotaenia]
MSSDIYAKPDHSKKVRYSRKKQEEECQGMGPQTDNPPPVWKGSFRSAKLCLTVLFLLMLAVIIFLSIYCKII